MEHTPGPWRSNNQAVYVDGKSGWIISTDSPWVTPSEAEANARLIAAAPDLLEALKLLWAETVAAGNDRASDYGWPSAREAVLAALSAASGRAPTKGSEIWAKD